METQTFDTLTYVKKLQSGGIPRKQAEAQAEALIAVVNHSLATKADIEVTRADIERLRVSARRDIEKLRSEVKNREGKMLLRLQDLENRLTIRMGLMFVTTVTILATLITLPPFLR